jgi:4-hydroxy-tetrahydrodipicolinate synthase
MRRLPILSGVLVPNVTPMSEGGAVDLAGYSGLAQAFLDAPGVDGLFSIGASGEYMHLDPGQRRELMAALGRLDRHGKVVMANAGGLPTAETLKLAEFAGEQGLDGVSVVLPTHVQDTPQDILDYYREVGQVGTPFMVYRPPMVTTHGLTPELVEALLEVPTFVGLKDSSRDLELFTILCERFGHEVSVIQGVEMLHLPALALGSAGVIGGGSNVYPGMLKRLTAAFEARDFATARKLQLQIIRAWAFLADSEHFRTLVKAMWRSRGVLTGTFSLCDGPVAVSADELEHALTLLDLGD